jgi:hypothetical protein
MQTITLIPVGSSIPELISGTDFYAALNQVNSVSNPENIIAIKDKRYSLKTLTINSISGTNAGYVFKDVFVPSVNGQTNFTLTQIPTAGIFPLLTIGGLLQEQGTDYNIAGNTLTWLNNSFQLSTTDRIIIYYS